MKSILSPLHYVKWLSGSYSRVAVKDLMGRIMVPPSLFFPQNMVNAWVLCIPYLINICAWCVAAYKSIQWLIHTNFNEMSPKMDSTIFKNGNYVSDLNLEIPQWMIFVKIASPMDFSCIGTNLTNKSKWDAIVIVILEPGFYTEYWCTKQTYIQSLTGRPHKTKYQMKTYQSI